MDLSADLCPLSSSSLLWLDAGKMPVESFLPFSSSSERGSTLIDEGSKRDSSFVFLSPPATVPRLTIDLSLYPPSPSPQKNIKVMRSFLPSLTLFTARDYIFSSSSPSFQQNTSPELNDSQGPELFILPPFLHFFPFTAGP